MNVIDPRLSDQVRRRLGPSFDDLLSVMTDLGTAPIFLNGDDRDRLVGVRTEALAAVDAWFEEDPQTVSALFEGLPDVLKTPSISASLLEGATWLPYFSLDQSILEVPGPDSRVLSALPDLARRMDKDGLIDISDLDASPHALFHADFALHYHQLLRRNFSSNVHYELVAAVTRLSKQHGLRARLAIDERRLRRRDEYEEWEERDHWFGPPFDDAALDDPWLVGETFHGDADGGLTLRNPYAGLSVRWTSDEGLKTVQIEEFLPPPQVDQGWVLARYLHAIRDTRRHVFVHCDGAVKAYESTRYPTTSVEFRSRDRSQHYRKVFRVDGAFPTEMWSTLATQWFRGNTLILEYFKGGGDSP